jgi:AcrR family transcriptional regulator
MLVREIQEAKPEDPRITRTRSMLTAALSELMREKSFDAITVREITERATLNRVTFYAHYQDKYALLEYAGRQMIRKQIDAQLPDETYSDENLRRLVLLVCNFVTDIDQHCPPPHGQLEPLMEKQIKTELYDVMLNWLSASKKNGASREQAAMMSAWALYGAAMQWSQDKNQKPAEDFVRQVMPLVKGNLQPFIDTNGSLPAKRASHGGSSSGRFVSLLRLQHVYR